MKTIQTISAVILISLTTFSHAENTKPQIKETLSISVIEIKMPTCNGEDNGSITVEAKGGKSPYTFNWNTFPNQTNAQAINLTKGIYFVQVTDAVGNLFYKSIEVSDPIEPQSKITTSGPENSSVNIAFLESVEKSTFTYFLNDTQIETPNLNALEVGIYELVISDISGCTVVTYIQVFEMEQDPNQSTKILTEASISPMVAALYNQTNSELTMIKH